VISGERSGWNFGHYLWPETLGYFEENVEAMKSSLAIIEKREQQNLFKMLKE
jgi:hypothetical protein